MNNLDKMKPMFTKNQKDITFDILEIKLGHHPIIIFYHEYNEEYYYVKARSAYDRNKNLKTPYEGEIFVPKAKSGLLNNDSYIDTTKIHHIKEEELEKYVSKEKVCDTLDLEPHIGLEIYETLIENADQILPFYSIIKVSWNDKIESFESHTEYDNEILLDKELKDYKNFNLKREKEDLANEIKNERNSKYKYHSFIRGSIWFERGEYIDKYRDELNDILQPRIDEFDKYLEESKKS